MNVDTNVLLRLIYLQAVTASDFETFKIHLKAIVGDENVALVLKALAEAKKD